MSSSVLLAGCCAMTETPDQKSQNDVQSAAHAGPAGAGDAAKRTLHPLAELTLTRVREFVREPEVIFWVFIFPVLLACALGIAFRNTTPERIRVAAEDDGQNAAIAQIVSALEKSPDVLPVLLDKDEAARALRTGNVAL